VLKLLNLLILYITKVKQEKLQECLEVPKN
jgi:hypothetical protein